MQSHLEGSWESYVRSYKFLAQNWQGSGGVSWHARKAQTCGTERVCVPVHVCVLV